MLELNLKKNEELAKRLGITIDEYEFAEMINLMSIAERIQTTMIDPLNF